MKKGSVVASLDATLLLRKRFNNERDSRHSSAGSGRSALPDFASHYAPRYATVTPERYRGFDG